MNHILYAVCILMATSDQHDYYLLWFTCVLIRGGTILIFKNAMLILILILILCL